MFPIRIKACSESDLRMLGDLARNIQRVLPVTQADIDAAAALGKGWVVWKVIEVNDPIDNLRGGTQLVIKQNSVTPGQNVRRVLIVSGPGGETVVVRGSEYIELPDAIANSLEYLKAFGGTKQGLPDGYIQRQFIYMMDGSYLLTDIVPTYDGHYELDFQTTTVSNVAAAYLGGRAGQSPAGLIFSHGSNNILVTDAFGQRYSIVERVENNTRYKYVFNNKVFTLYKNGEVVETHTFTSSTDSGAALAIKAINMGDSIDFAGEGIYLYGFKAWNNQGQLIADYVPAIQKGTVPVVGFYDTVSKTFKTATAGTFAAGGEAVPTPDAPMDIVCNNGVLKANKNLYGTEYNGYELSQVDGITLRANSGVNVSGMVDCRTIKSFKITTASPQGSFRIFKYRADNTYIDANSTANIGDIITLEDNVGFFRIQYNFTNSGTGTENVLIYNSAYDLNGIYADGTVETINVHGKNLFDKEQTYISAFVNSNTGVLTEASPNQRSFVIGCLPNTTYTLSGMTAASGWGSFTSSTIGTTATSFTTGNGTITTGANDKYLIGLAYVQGSSSYDYRNALQIELGSTATTYENYFNGGTATAEMLLKVGNYEDVQSIIDGVVTRNVGVKVLDGTEGWVVHSSSGAMAFNLLHKEGDSSAMGFCTHFEWVSTTVPSANLNIGQCKLATGSDNILIKTIYNNTTDWENWLAQQYANGTPVIMVYPLATATTESVAGQTMQVQQGDNFVEITQASLDNLELEAKYKKQA